MYKRSDGCIPTFAIHGIYVWSFIELDKRVSWMRVFVCQISGWGFVKNDGLVEVGVRTIPGTRRYDLRR